MIDLGKVKPGLTIRIPFGSYAAATGASSATTNYAAADVQIYKDGGTTQRASASGITATTDFDTLTGINLVSIDLSDNTTADFYASGSEYVVVIADVTVDGQTVRFPIARFIIGIAGEIFATTIATLTTQTSFTLTSGPADDGALVGSSVYIHDAASSIQCCQGVVSAYTGSTKTVTLAFDPAIYTIAAKDNISFFPRMNAHSFGGPIITSGAIPQAVAGASGGLFIAGSNAATTANITGNLTGNVSGSVGSVSAGVNAIQFAGQTITAASGVTLPATVASPTNITAGTITTVTNLTNAPTAGDLTATMKTSVKTQVTDGLNVDTYAEQAQGTPPATATFRAMLQWLYMAWRNKSTQTSSQYSLYADDTTTVVAKSSAADDGTTLTVGEKATGP